MIFQRMESGHNRLTHEIGISGFDTRLPRWRDAARSLFDQLWSKAAATGPMDEIQAGHFYVHCLARVMTDDGIAVPVTLSNRQIEILQANGRVLIGNMNDTELNTLTIASEF